MSKPVVDQIIEILQDKFVDSSPSELAESTRYAELEFDSLVLVELAAILSKRFSVDVSEEDVMSSETVGGTAAMLEARGVS